jgi:hypothetical protein
MALRACMHTDLCTSCCATSASLGKIERSSCISETCPLAQQAAARTAGYTAERGDQAESERKWCWFVGLGGIISRYLSTVE